MDDPPDWDGGQEDEYIMIMNHTGCDRKTVVDAMNKMDNQPVAAMWWITNHEDIRDELSKNKKKYYY